jgi:hypothetical protein
MTSVRVAIVVATLVAASGPVFGQTPSRPDFSGTWVEDLSLRKTTFPTGGAPGARAMSAPEADTVVTQTATVLTIERSVMSQVIRYVYRLDGGESVNHNGANTQTTKSAWERNTLVTRGTSFSVTSQGESTWDYSEKRSLDPKGLMVVETGWKDEAGTVNTTRRVFHRKPR